MATPKITDTLSWSEMEPAMRGAIIRAYGGYDYEESLFNNSGGMGVTDEELGSNPALWPQAKDANGNVIPVRDWEGPGWQEDYGKTYVDSLRSSGHKTMIAIDAGTWQQDENGMTLAYGDPTNGQGTPYNEDGGHTFHTYDPNRGITEFDKKNMTGVAPGVTIDMAAYGPDAKHQRDQDMLRNMAAYYKGLDPNRWSINPDDIGQIDTYTYDPATADIYTTNIDGVFDPTKQQLDYANELNDYAVNLDGSHLGQAADLQYLAATGQMPSIADMRLTSDSDRLQAQQQSMAARARGSSGAGLALLNAQNNSQLGYLGLAQAADVARVQEMTDARSAYAQTGNAIRQGDLQGASQAAQIGQQLYGVNNAELEAGKANTQQLNAGSQFNAGQENTAAQYGATAATDADKYNTDLTKSTLEGNRVAGMTTETGDKALAQGYDKDVIAQDEANRGTRIQGQEDFQHAVNDTSSILSNTYLGHDNTRVQAAIADRQADAQETGALYGAVAAGLGGIVDVASDRRLKDIHGKAEPADFSRVHDYDWSYDESVPPEDDWLDDGSTKSGMAQDFPDDLVYTDEDGNLRVNAMKALLRYAGSIGDVQRRVDKLEKR